MAVVNKSASKVFGTQNATKSIDSFTVKASAIPVTLTGTGVKDAKNVQDALERLDTKTASQTTAPGSPAEGDIWYDTDDDKFFVRDEDSWNEIVVGGISGTVDGGGYS